MKKEKIEDGLNVCSKHGTCLHTGNDCTEAKGADRNHICYQDDTSGIAPPSCFNTNCEQFNMAADFGCTNVDVIRVVDCADFVSAVAFLETAEPPVDVFVCGETSDVFKRELPVPVPENELAEYAKEMARLQTLWVRTKLNAKAYAKSAKEVTDHAEEDLLNIAQIVETGTEEREVDAYWQFDSVHCLKRLFRCDTGEMVEELTMTPADLQRDLNFQADQSEQNVLAMVQEGNVEGIDGPVEESTEEDNGQEP